MRALVLASVLVAAGNGNGNGNGKWTDTDHDGASDAEERRLGLDPAVVTVPEPLYFDMIRGLGARAGELELNVLTHASWGRLPAEPTVSPELELVPLPGVGLELEGSFDAAGFRNVRVGVQGTLPGGLGESFLHGWLALGTHEPRGDRWRGAALYIAAYRFDAHWSLLAMAGVELDREATLPTRAATLLNPSLFFDLSAETALGVELNHRHVLGESSELLVLPQVHWQPVRWIKAQAGAGMDAKLGSTGLAGALRVSLMN